MLEVFYMTKACYVHQRPYLMDSKRGKAFSPARVCCKACLHHMNGTTRVCAYTTSVGDGE